MNKYINIVCAFFCVLGAVNAETEKGIWKGEGELGFTSTSGNTDSENLNAKLGISKEKGAWKHTASIESIRTTTDNVTSADSRVLKEKSRYKFAEKTYAYGRLRYEEDEFSGFEYQGSYTLGAGSELIKNEKHSLDLAIGIGYRTLKEIVSQLKTDEGVVSGELEYIYQISKTASLSEEILFEHGDANTYTESTTSLKMKINGNLASKISYLVKHNSDVPAGVEKSDKVTTISLVYSF